MTKSDVIEYLELHGIYAWETHYHNQRSRKSIRKKGLGDVMGILPNGRHLELELKRKYEPQRDLQKCHMHRVNMSNALYRIVQCIEDVEEIVKSIKKGSL